MPALSQNTSTRPAAPIEADIGCSCLIWIKSIGESVAVLDVGNASLELGCVQYVRLTNAMIGSILSLPSNT